MHQYLLFLDIEASDLPKRWDLPYSAEGNWPYTIQVSWIIFTRDGRQLKAEDLYIKDISIAICERARKVHGLTQEFIHINGRSREAVLDRLTMDMETYRPIVIGHFIELDYHVLSADYLRAGKPNPMNGLPLFCTMHATRHLVRNPAKKYLRLEELYEILFDKSFSNQHNAFDDALATAECYFELVKRKEIDPSKDYKSEIAVPGNSSKPSGCRLPVLFIIAILFTLFIFL
jgi:DNA polymerase-3 subunit epsilon